GRHRAIGVASFAEARGMREFWTLCAVQALFFPALVTVPFHLAVHGTDLGLSVPRSALLLSEIGAASIVGRLLVGQLADRIGVRNAYLFSLAGLLAGLTGLVAATSPAALFAVVAVYGVAHGGLFVVVSPTVAAYFGLRAHGAIFAALVFCGTTSGAVGPTLAGAAFDLWGSYFHAFAGLAAAAALALVLVLTLPRPD
ncbi:MAG: MFS transporter, partial [Marinibacterium sp.]